MFMVLNKGMTTKHTISAHKLLTEKCVHDKYYHPVH